MNPSLLALAVALTAAPSAAGGSEPAAAGHGELLKLRSKAAVAEVLAPRTSKAPFREPLMDPELELFPARVDPRAESKAWTCDGERSLCYDPGSRRIVYKPARLLMPDLPGFTRENISVKRDRITFKYSF